ncbi:rod shape-determining protein MreD [Thalassobacillus hwangdonensis]|uniref:Rod shape-determining protein MreD n=1 Tax=Thalassobacillus hwangdonensis TaxID=546108 RepID=A0ABW3KZ51_9BACI
MPRILLPVFLLLLLVFQGMAMSLLPTEIVYSELLVTPHWVLALLVLISLFFDEDRTYYSLLYAVIFGLLIDIVYTNVLGVYMFTYGIVIYTVHGIRKVLQGNLFVALLLGIFALVLTETILYVLYYFIQVTTTGWQVFLSHRLLPTVVANLVFFLILYPLIRGRLMKWSESITKN